VGMAAIGMIHWRSRDSIETLRDTNQELCER
jgi:hypothetical protein